jgi:single-strand DNA-binding protein
MQIIGRVTADATVAETNSGKQVINFSVAENFSYKTKAGERKNNASFFDCAYWVNLGIAPYLIKGTIVRVEGRAKAEAYTTAQGEARARVVVHVDSVKLYGGGRTANTPEPADAGTITEPIEDLPF